MVFQRGGNDKDELDHYNDIGWSDNDKEWYVHLSLHNLTYQFGRSWVSGRMVGVAHRGTGFGNNQLSGSNKVKRIEKETDMQWPNHGVTVKVVL